MNARFIFDPSDSVMHTLALASGKGTNFREAVLASHQIGSNFSVDGLLTDKEYDKNERIGALACADEFKIPYKIVNGYQHCGSWKKAKETVEGRLEYEKRTDSFNDLLYWEVRRLEEESGIRFDAAVLAGYMRLFKGAMLRRFNNAALNVHPADLNERDEMGKRMYIGDNAVYDALVAGEERTRSCVILVDADTDAGPILVSGPWVNYAGPRPVTLESAAIHQSIQKEMSDWPSLRFALREIANGRFALHRSKFHLDGNPVVVYDGQEMPYKGYELI